MVRFKQDSSKGVSLKGWSLAIKTLFETLCWMDTHRDTFVLDDHKHMVKLATILPGIIWITSINDGVHSRKSRHYTNEAFDIRVFNLKNEHAKSTFRRAYERFLNERFPGLFRVLYEKRAKKGQHLHAQVKKGRKLAD